jgi:hypothetical protein
VRKVLNSINKQGLTSFSGYLSEAEQAAVRIFLHELDTIKLGFYGVNIFSFVYAVQMLFKIFCKAVLCQYKILKGFLFICFFHGFRNSPLLFLASFLFR